MDKLKEQIKILTRKESELLEADKLPKKKQTKTGLYLVCEDGRYTGFDYGDRHAWQEMFGGTEGAPEGWSKDFTNPLDALDWLLSLR